MPNFFDSPNKAYYFKLSEQIVLLKNIIESKSFVIGHNIKFFILKYFCVSTFILS